MRQDGTAATEQLGSGVSDPNIAASLLESELSVSVMRAAPDVVCFEGLHKAARRLAAATIFFDSLCYPIITLLLVALVVVPKLMDAVKIPTFLLPNLPHVSAAGKNLAKVVTDKVAHLAGEAEVQRMQSAAKFNPTLALEFGVITERDLYVGASAVNRAGTSAVCALHSCIDGNRHRGQAAQDLLLQHGVDLHKVQQDNAAVHHLPVSPLQAINRGLHSCLCMRLERAGHARTPSDIMDSSLALNTDELRFAEELVTTPLVPIKYPRALFLLSGECRASMFWWSSLDCLVIIITTMFTTRVTDSSPTLILGLQAVLLPLLPAAQGIGMFVLRPYRPAERWLAFVHAYIYILNATAALHVGIGSFRGSASAIEVAQGISYIVAAMCLGLIPVVVLSFVSSILQFAANERRLAVMVATSAFMGAQRAWTRLVAASPHAVPIDTAILRRPIFSRRSDRRCCGRPSTPITPSIPQMSLQANPIHSPRLRTGNSTRPAVIPSRRQPQRLSGTRRLPATPTTSQLVRVPAARTLETSSQTGILQRRSQPPVVVIEVSTNNPVTQDRVHRQSFGPTKSSRLPHHIAVANALPTRRVQASAKRH